jgi:hypothetical protein
LGAVFELSGPRSKTTYKRTQTRAEAADENEGLHDVWLRKKLGRGRSVVMLQEQGGIKEVCRECGRGGDGGGEKEV